MNNFERRIRAFSIDLSMAAVLFMLFVIVAMQFEGGSDALKFGITASIAYFGVLLVPHLFSRGQSFGKRNQRMQIANAKTGAIPPLMVIWGREILKGILLVSTFGFYMMISGIMLSARKDGRLLHDLLFGTKVVCLTRFVSDREGSVLETTESMKRRLEGSSHD